LVLSGDARRAREDWLDSDGGEQKYTEFDRHAFDVVVDALLGTGIDRAVTGEWSAAIETVNDSALPVVAVDLPSGINADSGAVMGVAVRADATVSFIGLKQGLLTGAAPEQRGRLYFNSLSVPEAVYQASHPITLRLERKTLLLALSPRPRTAHKGDFGHVLIVGGDEGMSGAALLAAQAALRSGAGLVSVATHPQHAAVLNLGQPELMVHPMLEARALRGLLQRATVVVIGPGLGKGDWGAALLAEVLASGLPCVIDADALNLLAEEDVQLPAESVLTPHPGEAARLLGVSSGEVQRDRYIHAETLHDRWQAVCVLKGAGTVVADATGTSVCAAGNPGMASGGMGDLLSGVIGALIAQGLSAAEAARLGVCVHAEAGDLAAREGERGLVASDLLAFLRPLLNEG
jgi:NAD(P)H-hydrate epimerase